MGRDALRARQPRQGCVGPGHPVRQRRARVCPRPPVSHWPGCSRERHRARGFRRGRAAPRASRRARCTTSPSWRRPTGVRCRPRACSPANLAAAAPVQVSRAHLAATGGRAAGVILTSGNANAATGGRRPGGGRTSLSGGGGGHRFDRRGGAGLPDRPHRDPVPDRDGHPRDRPHRDGAPRRRGGGRAGGRRHHDDRHRARSRSWWPATASVSEAWPRARRCWRRTWQRCWHCARPTPRSTSSTLQAALREAVAASFNAISVDGCTSTNDTVLVLASGLGARATPDALTAALTEACRSLAEQMVADAEGATKVAHIRVRGAANDHAAHVAARKVADSMLVQCSLFGEDPYWGRIVSELGSAGTPFDIDRVSVAYGGTVVCAAGEAVAARRRRGGGPHGGSPRRDRLRPRAGAGRCRRARHRPRLRLHRREQDDVVSTA